MTKTWQNPEWKENKAKFLLEHPTCAWCGKKASVPHHPQKRGSISEADYISLKDCIPLCNRCHFAACKGLKLCPVCNLHYYKPKRRREQMCWTCFSQTPFGAKVKAYYDKHPEEVKK